MQPFENRVGFKLSFDRSEKRRESAREKFTPTRSRIVMRAVLTTGVGFAAPPRKSRASYARRTPQLSVTCRNRILFREGEVQREDDGVVSVSLSSADPRAVHARDVLKVRKGDTLRVGVLNDAPATADVHTCPTDADPSGELTLRWRAGEERDDPDTARRALSSRAASVLGGVADGFRGAAYDGIATHGRFHDTSVRIDLLLAVPRPKVLKRLWAPLASLGVGAVYLTNAARVEKCYFDASSVAAETVQRELIRGLEQSGDVFVPRVTLVKRFPAVLDAIGVTGRDPRRESVRALTASLDEAKEKAARRALDESPADDVRHRLLADDLDTPLMLVAQPGSTVTLRRALRGAGADAWGYGPRRVVLAIGPEGGWSDHELSVLRKGGFAEVALGNRTLATDVACVALIAAIKERTESW